MKKFVKIFIVLLSLLVVICSLTGCSSKSVEIKLSNGYDYSIDSDVDEVFLFGNADGKMLYNVCIKVANRKKNLVVNLEDVNFYASEDHPAIFCENTSFNLTVRFTGQCTIVGGNGSRGKDGKNSLFAWYGSDGAPGQAALVCGKVIFEGADSESTLTLKGGCGGNGGNAGSVDTVISGLIDKPNGGNGGDASPALICKSSSLNYDNVSFIAGNYGYGGKAGYCGIVLFHVYGQPGQSGKAAKAVICS